MNVCPRMSFNVSRFKVLLHAGPMNLNDTDSAWEIAFITLANDRTISPWVILIPIPSFLFRLIPNIFLCFCLLLYFLNVILLQNTSYKHFFFFYKRISSLLWISTLSGFFSFSFSTESILSGRELFLFCGCWSTTSLRWRGRWSAMKRTALFLSSQGFSCLIKDSCKAMWHLWQISCRWAE